MNILKLSGAQHKALYDHLFCGDENEAVALLRCGRNIHNGDHTLTVKEITLIPYDKCYERKPDLVRWPTSLVNPLLEAAAKDDSAIVKIHCHPGGGEFFSGYDNESDEGLFSCIHNWLDSRQPHASCIMLPGGRIFGRFFFPDMQTERIDKIAVAGSDISIWNYYDGNGYDNTLHSRNLQTFGSKTIHLLSNLKIGIIGCSGTGSIVTEQLKRLGVGTLVLVDPEVIEAVNLNRIIGATHEDAVKGVKKVEVMQREIEKAGFGTKVIPFGKHISHYDVVKELAQCDVLFGCVDSAEGRHIANQISSHYLLPLFDLGVRLDTDGNGGIEGIYGTVHYIQPSGSSLLSRKVYTPKRLDSEITKRQDEDFYAKNQYLQTTGEVSAAVISVNMQIAAIAVNEFLARIHPYRNISNEEVDAIRVLFSDLCTRTEEYKAPCLVFSKLTGLGDTRPLLNNIELKKDDTQNT
jgi:hypothetical protein